MVRSSGKPTACSSPETSSEVPRRGLPAGYLVPPAEQCNDHSHAEAERTLGKLFEYDISTILASHGSHVTEDPLGEVPRGQVPPHSPCDSVNATTGC